MALFTKRDRIAIAFIATLILTGWGLKLAIYRSRETENLRIIRNAVKLPSVLESIDSLTVEFPDIYSPVDINNADTGELETLPLIGPVKAAAIIEYREKHGFFTDIADIMKVKGIGPATYEKIRKRITVNSKNGLKE